MGSWHRSAPACFFFFWWVGGSRWVWPKKGRGSIWRPKIANFLTPPFPNCGCFVTFPNMLCCAEIFWWIWLSVTILADCVLGNSRSSELDTFLINENPGQKYQTFTTVIVFCLGVAKISSSFMIEASQALLPGNWKSWTSQICLFVAWLINYLL